ncbi:MAG: VOC family protein [Spirochaetaceae bacterium]|nr:VOC family protein [Spirochaetaceae bacterium]
MKNPVVHFEIQSQDPAALRGFYTELFDWQVQHHEAIDYSVLTTKGEDDPAGINGGIAPTNGGPGSVTFYVQVDDIEERLRKAVELGATVIMPVTTIPKTVTFALFADPQGNCIGMAAREIPD